MNTIAIHNLSFSYPGRELIRDLSLEIEEGSFIAIAGPNGAGKTTLLRLLTGALKPQTGTIRIDDRHVTALSDRQRARKMAVVEQEFIPPFGYTALQTVLIARTSWFDLLGFETQRDLDIARESLVETETLHLADRPLSHLSGGERQRVFIARALAQNTPILLLDEPTSFLDMRHQVGVYELLKKLQNQQNKTIIAITHDLNLAGRYCDCILLLGSNQEHFLGSPSEILTTEIIRKVFEVTGRTVQVENDTFFFPTGRRTEDLNSNLP